MQIQTRWQCYKQRCNEDKCRCECKELIDKGVCEKGFIWNPCNCECECDKSCEVGEYLDYENCKCRKKLVDKLVEECTENAEEFLRRKGDNIPEKRFLQKLLEIGKVIIVQETTI